MIPYADVESDVLDRFSSSDALRNRSQIVRDPHGSYRSGKSAPDRPMGAKTTRGLTILDREKGDLKRMGPIAWSTLRKMTLHTKATARGSG